MMTKTNYSLDIMNWGGGGGPHHPGLGKDTKKEIYKKKNKRRGV